MDLVSAIKKRRSVRRYDGNFVPQRIIGQVTDAGRRAVPLHPEIDVRWHVVWDGATLAPHLEGISGTYGMVASAPHYVLAISQERTGYLEDLGFRMEQMILTATGMGLGTCWIAGTFTEADLRPLVPDLGARERIVALTPLGYADESAAARMARRLLTWSTSRPGKRKPLAEIVSQYIWTLPWMGEDEALNEILELARLAPSRENAQPWHLVVDDQRIVATVDLETQEETARADKSYYRLDGGIAMCHLWVGTQAAGWTSQWHVLEAAGRKMLRDRYAIPDEHAILGILPRPTSSGG